MHRFLGVRSLRKTVCALLAGTARKYPLLLHPVDIRANWRWIVAS